MRSYVLPFRPSCVGRGTTIHAEQGQGNLEALRAHFYGKQMLGPSSATCLLRYFADAVAYSAGINKLVSWGPLHYRTEERIAKEKEKC